MAWMNWLKSGLIGEVIPSKEVKNAVKMVSIV